MSASVCHKVEWMWLVRQVFLLCVLFVAFPSASETQQQIRIKYHNIYTFNKYTHVLATMRRTVCSSFSDFSTAGFTWCTYKTYFSWTEPLAVKTWSFQLILNLNDQTCSDSLSFSSLSCPAGKLSAQLMNDRFLVSEIWGIFPKIWPASILHSVSVVTMVTAHAVWIKQLTLR